MYIINSLMENNDWILKHFYSEYDPKLKYLGFLK